jgi:hypothetical protein
MTSVLLTTGLPHTPALEPHPPNPLHRQYHVEQMQSTRPGQTHLQEAWASAPGKGQTPTPSQDLGRIFSGSRLKGHLVLPPMTS